MSGAACLRPGRQDFRIRDKVPNQLDGVRSGEHEMPASYEISPRCGQPTCPFFTGNLGWPSPRRAVGSSMRSSPRLHRTCLRSRPREFLAQSPACVSLIHSLKSTALEFHQALAPIACTRSEPHQRCEILIIAKSSEPYDLSETAPLSKLQPQKSIALLCRPRRRAGQDIRSSRRRLIVH